jgi:hypothetical protein
VTLSVAGFSESATSTATSTSLPETRSARLDSVEIDTAFAARPTAGASPQATSMAAARNATRAAVARVQTISH